MVALIPALQTAQDGDGILHRRLVHEHRHETAGQRRVTFDIFAVLIQRGRADTVQFAARKGGFQQVGGVHGAIGFPGADQGVHLIDEENDPTLGLLNLVEHGFQPLLELAAEFRPGDQRAHVERHQLLVLQAFRHIAIDNAQGEAFHNGGFTDARLTNQDRIVLGPAREHLHGAADFLVAANDRIKLAVARILGQVAGIFLQRVIAFLGGSAVSRAALAKLGDGAFQRLHGDAGILQRSGSGCAGRCGEREQDTLDGDIAVAGLFRAGLGGCKELRALLVEPELAVAPGYARELAKRGIDSLDDKFRAPAGGANEIGGELVAVVQHGFEHMLGREGLVTACQRRGLRALQDGARTFGVLV